MPTVEQPTLPAPGPAAIPAAIPVEKLPWPSDLAQQAALVRQIALGTNWTTAQPLSLLAAHFTNAKPAKLKAVVEALATLGQIR